MRSRLWSRVLGLAVLATLVACQAGKTEMDSASADAWAANSFRAKDSALIAASRTLALASFDARISEGSVSRRLRYPITPMA